MQPIITFEDVSYSYPNEKTFALKDISLSVERQEFLVVMGENGSGKTSLCRLINGIISHSTGGRLLGRILIDGEDTKGASVAKLACKAGTVSDDPDAQLFTSSVFHETAFGLENLLMPPDEIKKRADYALEAVGLADFKERIPSTLSGGEKQRLVIAAALCMSCFSETGKILVLDDPLSRLDPQGAAEIISLLHDIRHKFQLTVVMTTYSSNYPEFYLSQKTDTGNSKIKLADRICILNKGKLAACNTAENILFDRSLLEQNGIEPPIIPDIHYSFPALCKDLYSGEENPAVKINNLFYSYGTAFCLENFSLSIKDNDFIAIAGCNGSGKTTLLKIITGLLRPHSGEIFIRGRNINNLSVSEISKEAGFVMQNPDTQLFTDSVFNEAAFALKNAGYSKIEIKKRAENAIAAVGLENPGAFPHALSRSDRTKTVLASVLAMGCKILIFDEIDVGQDYRGSRKIMDIARNLHKEGYTIIFVTHNIALACEYAQRFVMIDKKGILMDKRIYYDNEK